MRAAALISLALLAISHLSEATKEESLEDTQGPGSEGPVHPHVLAVDQIEGDHAKLLENLKLMSPILKLSEDTKIPLQELAELADVSSDNCNHEFSSYWHRLSQKYRNLSEEIRRLIDHHEEAQTLACEENLTSDLESLQETIGEREVNQLKALREAIAANAEPELPTEPNRLYLEIPREGMINGLSAYLRGQPDEPLIEIDDQKTFEAKFEKNVSQICKDALKAVEATSFGFVLDFLQDGYDKPIEEMLSNAKICQIMASEYGPFIAKASFEALTNEKSD